MFESGESDIDSIIKKINKGRRFRINNIDCINLKLKINKYKLFNEGVYSYYLYNGEIISINSDENDYGEYSHWIDIVDDSEDEFIKKINSSILYHEQKITELEDAIQKIYHGGYE
jgi:hypothetical protein